MSFYVVLLLISTFLCSLVTGFVFTFAVIVMPGLTKLDDSEFVRAFQVTDEIIQNNQPIFMFVWIGSIISVLSTMVMSFMTLDFVESWLVIATGFVYLLGVQGLTIFVHLPLNKRIQHVNVGETNPELLHKERILFEARWTHFNRLRTIIACIVTASFMISLSMNLPKIW